MHSSIRWRPIRLLPAFLLLVTTSLGAQTAPKGAARGFRLFARTFGAITVNRVYCGLNADGELCVDSTNSSTIGGGYWPKNSPQQYVFNSGLQVAGTIQDTLGWAWAGDTTGALFFDPKGTTQHGQQVEPIWNYASADDRAHWPQAAYVPEGDATAALYDPSLRGRPSASEGDIWTLAWEGDPALLNGRPHPLGVAVETRVLGWNYPRWNNDVIYFVHTFYNISSNCAGDYAGVRPGLREELLTLGQRFVTLNQSKFGITIPPCGYTINELWMNTASDPDVSSDAGNNYASTNIPMALGYAYEDSFRRTDGGYPLPAGSYLLPVDLRSPPFMNAYGYFGMKYLKTPLVGGVAPGTTLYSNTTGGSSFNDPQNVQQLYRYISGNISPALGDGLCNYSPATDRMCFVKSDGHSDTRFWQSTGPASLSPGGSVTIVTAYLFASPVATAGCTAPGCPSVLPGDPRRLSDAVYLQSQGANLVDSIAGFRGYLDDNGDGKVQPSEFRTVPGSLMGKAQLAQAIFDRGFLLPSAPAAPDFFLVPGDDQVGVLWRPSTSEGTGDLYFQAASDPASPAYDPNFRQFDVEGYRIYRGRADDPAHLTLLAQFDYANTTMRDYLGAVNPRSSCAPELGRSTTAQGCPVNFSTPAPGGAYTAFTIHDIVSHFIQVKLGDRFLAIDSTVFVAAADTAVTGGGSGRPELWNGGVPYTYLDHTARNNLRYFYAVTAFDVNSIQSGPSSLESARIVKSVTPVAPASNYDNVATLSVGVFGRGVNMSTAIPADPVIAPTTGVFSGPARPATGAQIGFVGDLVKQLVARSGAISLTLDSMAPGSAYDNAPATYWYHLDSEAGAAALPIAVLQDQFAGTASASGEFDAGLTSETLVQRYGGSGAYPTPVAYSLAFPGNYYTAAFGRGCVNSASGFITGRCPYNGARWFDGTAESYPHPTRGNNATTVSTTPAPNTEPTNAGSLSGVAHVYEARAYQTRSYPYRSVEGVLGTVATAADYRLHWGPGGSVDSVVDITHNVRVPFRTDMTRGYSWGFLTQAGTAAAGSGDGRPGVLTVTDLGCVPPMKSFAAPNAHLMCAPGTTYQFAPVVSFGPVAYGATVATDNTAPAAADPGFGIYLAGHFFLIEMNSTSPTAPAAGTVWTMRSYVGSINGGGGSVGTAGDLGSYSFIPRPSPFTAVGASLTAAYTVTNRIRGATGTDLRRVHTIPDPYYLRSGYETQPGEQVIKFVNLPAKAIIRIYTTSGILVRVLEHSSALMGGEEDWDVRNRDGRLVATGVYFYHIEASDARHVGRMTIVTSKR